MHIEKQAYTFGVFKDRHMRAFLTYVIFLHEAGSNLKINEKSTNELKVMAAIRNFTAWWCQYNDINNKL